jgi:hypothetical protein
LAGTTPDADLLSKQDEPDRGFVWREHFAIQLIHGILNAIWYDTAAKTIPARSATSKAALA